jgi:hypothetical protein
MERTQYDWQHQYLVTPWEYPISANENHSTYDQFIQLRDTLIFTWKYYNDKASRKLCVGDKGDGTTTNTIEVWLPNYFRQWIQPDWATNPPTPSILWTYITAVPADIKAQDNRFWELSCMIQKDGHYRIMHKEEILLQASTNKVFCYVDVYRKDGQWNYQIQYKWWVAVYDWEWQTSLSGSTSWTDPNWSCTVPITLWKLFKKMTAIAEQERDLLKWDILVLRMKDWPHDPSTWEPTGNNLTLQQDSNYWSIEYLDLPYNI